MDQVFIGVDTHKANHIAVALNAQGARLGTITIAANEDGYRRLDAWANGLGRVTAFGIEGTGSYGAGLSRDLQARGHTVFRSSTAKGWILPAAVTPPTSFQWVE